MSDWQERLEKSSLNMSYLARCLESYQKKNPKDASRANAYVSSVIRSSIAAGDSFDLNHGVEGKTFEQRKAYESLATKKPDINKGRPLLSKLGAKIKAVWSKDYGALNEALAAVQKDAQANPSFYSEAMNKAFSHDGVVDVAEAAKSMSFENDKANNHYRFTETYRAEQRLKENKECSAVFSDLAWAMDVYKVQNPKDALRAEMHVMKTLRAYAGIHGFQNKGILDEAVMPSADFDSKDSAYNLMKGKPSVTKGQSFFKRMATKIKGRMFATNGEKYLNETLAKTVKAIQKNPSAYEFFLREGYDRGGNIKTLADVTNDAKESVEFSKKRVADTKRTPLQSQLEQVQENLYRASVADRAEEAARPVKRMDKMSDFNLKRVLKGVSR